MLELQRRYARRLVGQRVQVACATGPVFEGQLMSFNGHSLWLVDRDDVDRFVPVDAVIGLAGRVG